MNLQQVLLTLRSRWLLVTSIFVLILVPVVAVNLLLPKLYTAAASVIVDLRPDPVAGQVNPAQVLPQYMATQIDVVTSPRVARRVVKLLKLDEDPGLLRSWQVAAKGRGDVIDFIGGLLKRKLAVRPAGESNVIDIAVTWPNARAAADIANAFAQAYVETTIELTVEPAKQYASSFSERADALRADLQAKQKLLRDFESENGLVVTDDRLDVEQSRLAELSTQLVAIQAQRQDSQSRERQASGSPDSMAEVLQSPVITQLKADLARAQVKLDDIGTRFGSSHPQYVSAESEVSSLRERIAQESQRVVASLTSATRVNQRREHDVIAALEAQKQRLIQVKHQHDQAQILQNDVLTAQRNLDTVTQRLAQSSLEGQTQQTNLAVLTRAIEPLEPSTPKILLNCVLAAIAGLALGIAAAIVRERTDLRVRTEADLGALIGIPVLGRMPDIRSGARITRASPALPRYTSA